MNIGKLIKQAREEAGLTQAELGEKIGTSGVTIMRYEKGQRQPRLEQIQKIAEVLGTTMSHLMEHDSDIVLTGEYVNKEIHYVMSKESIAQWHEDTLQAMANDPKVLVWYAMEELNPEGQQKAVERVEELTEIPKYQRQENTPPPPTESDSGE